MVKLEHRFSLRFSFRNECKRWSRFQNTLEEFHMSFFVLIKIEFTKQQKAFFLRHTTHLPSSTSSAGPLPPPLLHQLWGGSTSMFTSGGPLPCSLLGDPLPCSLPGGPLPCSLLGGPLPCSLLGGVHFHVQFWGVHFMFTSEGSTSMFTSGGSHMTYPIMLLYTTIEHPSASWAKFTWDPPPQLDRQTDRQTQ